MASYIDTSALAKWYVREAGSDEFEAWIQLAETPTISSLTLVEMRCLLSRRRRAGSLDAGVGRQAFQVLSEHVNARLLALEPVEDGDLRAAVHLMERLDRHSLRTLDAVHLALAAARGFSMLATADAVMAAAASEMGIDVVRFDAAGLAAAGGR